MGKIGAQRQSLNNENIHLEYIYKDFLTFGIESWFPKSVNFPGILFYWSVYFVNIDSEFYFIPFYRSHSHRLFFFFEGKEFTPRLDVFVILK